MYGLITMVVLFFSILGLGLYAAYKDIKEGQKCPYQERNPNAHCPCAGNCKCDDE